MGKLLFGATELKSLRNAWQVIRANGAVSIASETRDAIEMFNREAETNLTRIQRRVRAGKFEFDPQKGVLKKSRAAVIGVS